MQLVLGVYRFPPGDVDATFVFTHMPARIGAPEAACVIESQSA